MESLQKIIETHGEEIKNYVPSSYDSNNNKIVHATGRNCSDKAELLLAIQENGLLPSAHPKHHHEKLSSNDLISLNIGNSGFQYGSILLQFKDELKDLMFPSKFKKDFDLVFEEYQKCCGQLYFNPNHNDLHGRSWDTLKSEIEENSDKLAIEPYTRKTIIAVKAASTAIENGMPHLGWFEEPTDGEKKTSEIIREYDITSRLESCLSKLTYQAHEQMTQAANLAVRAKLKELGYNFDLVDKVSSGALLNYVWMFQMIGKNLHDLYDLNYDDDYGFRAITITDDKVIKPIESIPFGMIEKIVLKDQSGKIARDLIGKLDKDSDLFKKLYI